MREIQKRLKENYSLFCYVTTQKDLLKIFNATVNSVVNFGLFISSDETPIQGLIHISSLGNEYFIYNEKRTYLLEINQEKYIRLEIN